jgi:hypothetical protein
VFAEVVGEVSLVPDDAAAAVHSKTVSTCRRA